MLTTQHVPSNGHEAGDVDAPGLQAGCPDHVGAIPNNLLPSGGEGMCTERLGMHQVEQTSERNSQAYQRVHFATRKHSVHTARSSTPASPSLLPPAEYR